MATALFSLMSTIDQIRLHPRPPISLDQTQVESLTEIVTYLLQFLETYSLEVGYEREADPLVLRIADAAHVVEDVIESHIVDRILAGSTARDGKGISFFSFFSFFDCSFNWSQGPTDNRFYESLQEVIKDMDAIKKEVMEMKDEMRVQGKPQKSSASAAGSSRFSSTGKKTTMVGFDDVLLEIMDNLTGDRLDRQIIPIVGMGGIGKTTIARKLCENLLIKEHFDICAWATFSQVFDAREVLRTFLRQVNLEGSVLEPDTELSKKKKVNLEGREYISELGETLYKHLSGRRYLFVMDDMWSIDAWDDIKFFFPDYNNGSRIVVTTRLSNLALQLNGSYSLQMKFLDEEKSWDLFCRTVFKKEGCHSELEEIGKEIVRSCRGLPLSIVVIGGLLAKSKKTQVYWQYIAENLNSIVNSEDDESCLRALYMSYSQLPVYLKLCFLYTVVFKEDYIIPVSLLTKLWAGEGFIKSVSGKSLEEIAVEYLKELIDRNLLLVHNWGSSGNIKSCYIHDLLRDLCLREAHKERVYIAIRQQSHDVPQDTNTQRGIIIPQSTSSYSFCDVLPPILPSMSFVRSFICSTEAVLPSFNIRLLKVLLMVFEDVSLDNDMYSIENIFQLVNLRFLFVGDFWYANFPPSVCLLWNLQTLIGDHSWELTAPAEIWNMPQLRHIRFNKLILPDPPSTNIDGRDDIVLENLQMLQKILNFNCGEELVKRIPNIKKLKVKYEEFEGMSRYCLNNLERLHKLESFTCTIFPDTRQRGIDHLQNLTFPLSLKKLTLKAKYLHWEDMLEKMGSLPLLEKLKLKLKHGYFQGRNWETTEGHFRSLKYLEISGCDDLKYWKTESSHFPRLEHLVLIELKELKEIPSEIGQIPTLKSIELRAYSIPIILSAKKILEEQEELHGEVSLQVRVSFGNLTEELENLASPNFQIHYRGYETLKFRRLAHAFV